MGTRQVCAPPKNSSVTGVSSSSSAAAANGLQVALEGVVNGAGVIAIGAVFILLGILIFNTLHEILWWLHRVVRCGEHTGMPFTIGSFLSDDGRRDRRRRHKIWIPSGGRHMLHSRSYMGGDYLHFTKCN